MRGRGRGRANNKNNSPASTRHRQTIGRGMWLGASLPQGSAFLSYKNNDAFYCSTTTTTNNNTTTTSNTTNNNYATTNSTTTTNNNNNNKKSSLFPMLISSWAFLFLSVFYAFRLIWRSNLHIGIIWLFIPSMSSFSISIFGFFFFLTHFFFDPSLVVDLCSPYDWYNLKKYWKYNEEEMKWIVQDFTLSKISPYTEKKLLKVLTLPERL